MNVRTVDVFDTLLASSIVDAAGAAQILSMRLRKGGLAGLPNEFSLDFATIRAEAETRALEGAEYQQVTLEQIYDNIARRYPSIERETLSKIQRLEEDIEVHLCYPIKHSTKIALELISAQQRVVLVADTYHSKETVVRMLNKAAPPLADLPLYLSSELQLREVSGDLHAAVAEREGVDPSQLLAIGDDPDIPQSAEHSPDIYPNPIEAAGLNGKSGMTGLVYTGISRQVRLQQNKVNQSTDFNLGASYTAPLFYGFIQWCLKKAASSGIRDVYFLARDGYVFIEIAKRLRDRIAPEARLHYLYISRQSTFLASIFSVTDRSLDWVFEEMDNIISLERVAQRLHCSCDDLVAIIPTKDRPLPSQRLQPGQIRRVRKAILDSPEFLAQIEASAEEARNALKGYLKQFNFDGSAPLALVDIGWKASIQDCIFRTLSAEQPELHLEGYYYGCSNFSSFTSSNNRKHPYQMNPSNRPGLGPILELLLMAPHGTTLGYQKDKSGNYAPQLKAYNHLKGSWNMEAYIDGISAFTEAIIKIQEDFPELEIYPRAIDLILLELLEKPPVLLAESLGDLPYCGDQEESHPRAIAPAFTVADALRHIFGSSNARADRTQWFEASYMRSSPLPKIILALDPRHLLAACARYSLRRFSAKS